MRKITTIEVVRSIVRKFDHTEMTTLQARKATVYYHADWSEYWVRFYIDGQHVRKADSPADSKDEAIATADYFVNREL